MPRNMYECVIAAGTLLKSLYFKLFHVTCVAHLLHNCDGGGRVVNASVSETSVWSSTPTNAIVCDAYTPIIKKKNCTIVL